MKAILVILFIILFIGNSYICTWLYPYDPANAETYHYFNDWYYMRDRIYELMFLIAICFPFTKGTRLSRAVVFGGFIIVLSSVSDKLLIGQYTTMLRDWLVIVPAAVAMSTFVYMRSK